MDVKFQNDLCTCAPTKIEGYGKYIWEYGSGKKLLNIPRLPDKLFKMISAKRSPQQHPAQHQQQQQQQHQPQQQTKHKLMILGLSALASQLPSWITVLLG